MRRLPALYNSRFKVCEDSIEGQEPIPVLVLIIAMLTKFELFVMQGSETSHFVDKDLLYISIKLIRIHLVSLLNYHKMKNPPEWYWCMSSTNPNIFLSTRDNFRMGMAYRAMHTRYSLYTQSAEGKSREKGYFFRLGTKKLINGCFFAKICIH